MSSALAGAHFLHNHTQVKLRHISPDNNDPTCRWIFNVETPPANFTDAAYAQEVAAQNSDGAQTKKDD
jgi:hypothetical protein